MSGPLRALRPAVCLAVVASLAGAGVAGAAVRRSVAPKPVCNLVTDPAGDASLQPPLPSDDALDIISADIASDAKYVTAVIRVKNLSGVGLTPAGRVLRMQFALAGADAPVFMSYGSSAYGGKAFEYGLMGQGAGGSTQPTGTATGAVDIARNQVRITVPVADLGSLGKVKPGSKISALDVTAEQLVGVAPNSQGVYAFESFTADEAKGTKPYIAGTPSCVKPGP